ncbi:YdeI/OmpD-associated family protein [Perlabentimonas gracilis]|uniref:YdeI/OmpD-associated family protein n=1 Tax=Perlabentimonas gracilis TaxID=2715279 RepID=UPI001409AFEA|nr:YdeI/OmpD-associated family protein [Perlabentimonas gracilis]NHB68636.1 hypothetical protein [Perlabentimonas gracilis]
MPDYNKQWESELAMLKSIIQKTGLQMAIKWGAEVYTHKGKNVVSYYGFKNYFAIWFYNGVFLEDKHKVLVNAQDNKTKALRQWRFTSKEEIDENLILEYIRKAIKNEDDGKVWKPLKSNELSIPEALIEAFKSDREIENAFKKLPFYKQKEFVEYIDSAKREETKLARIDKIIPMILQGTGLNDKYKKC